MVEREVKMMLHAHRDCLRNKGVDTTKVRFDCRDGYYGEAFGIMRGLNLMGFGYFGSSNLDATNPHENGGGGVGNTQPEHNLKWWKDYVVQLLERDGTYYVSVAWGRADNYYPQQEQLKLKTTSRWQAEDCYRDAVNKKVDKGYRRKDHDNNWRLRQHWG